MTIIMTGKISYSSIACEKCGTVKCIWEPVPNIKCNICGAFYNMINKELKDQGVEITFEFVEFRCINTSITCSNICPAPEMYCRDHTSDEALEEIKNIIKYWGNGMDSAKDKLQKMEDSKKVWLIKEISGVE